jgi:hypothetical protein
MNFFKISPKNSAKNLAFFRIHDLQWHEFFRPAEKPVDCITLDSDSEEEEVAPPTSKRARLTAFLDEEDSSSTRLEHLL